MDNIVFTPAALLDLLIQIPELSNYDMGITETMDGQLQLQIGDSIYILESEKDNTVMVEDNVIEQVEDINTQAYENLESDGQVAISEDVIESGVIKELAKSLLLGGMIRLSSKLLK